MHHELLIFLGDSWPILALFGNSLFFVASIFLGLTVFDLVEKDREFRVLSVAITGGCYSFGFMLLGSGFIGATVALRSLP